MSLAVLLPAAGSSSRFGAKTNKLVQLLAGKPVIAHTLAAFLCRQDVKQVIIAAGDDSDVARERHPAWLELLRDPRIVRVPGGASRAHSVLAALQSVNESIEWVAVHDAARPLVSHDLVDRTLALARQHGAAVPAMPVALTIKKAHGPLPAKSLCTVPRHELWAMQTPQIARRRDLLVAYDRCPVPLDQVTDDMQLIELAGGEVYLAAGEERNLKITTQMDLLVAEMLLSHPAQ
jgi:2-C-methyl-D-erythritol 4-phosphate cytidylyltransferase